MKPTPIPPGESKPVPEHTPTDKSAQLSVDEATKPGAVPPTHEEFQVLAAQVRRLAAQITHGRA